VFAEIELRDGDTVFSLKNTSQNPIDRSGDTLTEQFIRGDRARQTEGSGLGLYIAKSLVELMGGSFTIQASGDLFEVEIVLKCEIRAGG
jgi:signal transduction histidine kinase